MGLKKQDAMKKRKELPPFPSFLVGDTKPFGRRTPLRNPRSISSLHEHCIHVITITVLHRDILGRLRFHRITSAITIHENE
jgi:hypothetical protein